MDKFKLEEIEEFSYNDTAAIIKLIGKYIESWKEIQSDDHVEITRFASSPNITMMINVKWNSINPNCIVLRIFKNKLYNRKLEQAVVELLWDQELCTKYYYQNELYRIEDYFESRQITNFEMRNPLMLKIIIKNIFKINHNPLLKDKVIEVTNGKNSTRADIMIDEMYPKLLERFDKIYDKITVEEYK